MRDRRWLFRNHTADRRDNAPPPDNVPSATRRSVAAAQVRGWPRSANNGRRSASPFPHITPAYPGTHAHLCATAVRVRVPRLLLCPADIFEHPIVVHLVCRRRRRRRPSASGGNSTAVFRNDDGSPPPPPPEARTTARRHNVVMLKQCFPIYFLPRSFSPPSQNIIKIFTLPPSSV